MEYLFVIQCVICILGIAYGGWKGFFISLFVNAILYTVFLNACLTARIAS